MEYNYYDHTNLSRLITDLINMDREVQERGLLPVLALDTETTGLDPLNDRLQFIQLYHPDFTPFFVDVRRMRKLQIAALLNLYWDSERWLKLAHNMSFDAEFLLVASGLLVKRPYCSAVSERLLTAGLRDGASLAEVSEKYLGHHLNKEIRLDFLNLPRDERPTEEMIQYAIEDVYVLPGIYEAQKKALEARGLMRVARLEFSILPSLVLATIYGVRIDPVRWRKHITTLELERDKRQVELVKKLQPHLDKYRARKYEREMKAYEPLAATRAAAAGYRDTQAAELKQQLLDKGFAAGAAQAEVNRWKKDNPPPPIPKKPVLSEEPMKLGSSEQLGGALIMMRVPIKTNGNGNFVTDKFAMRDLADDYPICQDIRDWREYEKMITAFGEAIMKRVDPDNRLHPEYNQCVSTGRMSCSKPNIQQVPADTEMGKELRRCFIAPPGKKLVAADYSQIELRILAELSGEEAMIRAFEQGIDLHAATAADMFGVPLDTVLPEDGKNRHLRKKAKPINFGIAYGLTAGGLAHNERIPIKEAREYLKRHQEAYPRLHEWLRDTGDQGLRVMYAETMLGRKRFFEPIVEADPGVYMRRREKYRRMITNHPIQGTSADITKLALYKMSRHFTDPDVAVPILFVHDEIVVEAVASDADTIAETMVALMKNAAEYFLKVVPVEVSYKISDTWEH